MNDVLTDFKKQRQSFRVTLGRCSTAQMSVQDGRSTSESEEDKRGAKGQDRSSNKDSGGEGTRVVLCAVDASRHSKHAFDCEFPCQLVDICLNLCSLEALTSLTCT